MDIKLRARLSAYSKIESISGLGNSSSLPKPTVTDSGQVLGVNSSGNYTLFPSIQKEDIDTLFADLVEEETVTKEEIDELFPEDDETVSVTKDEIDSLFNNDVVNAVDKDKVDDLLESDSQIGTVTFTEIDSLFN